MPGSEIISTQADNCSAVHSVLHFPNLRSSHPKVFCTKGVLRNFSKFTGKYLCQGLFFNKIADLRPKISNNTFSYRTPLVAASVIDLVFNKIIS